MSNDKTNTQSGSWFSQHLIEILFFFCYIVLVILGVLSHENWRDEAQAWFLSRDLGLIELIKQLKFEGHMLPWYLVIMPFAKLGAPYRIINAISAVFVIAAGGLFIFKAPFGRIPNCLFLFTLPMLYTLPSIARCYCLVPLATVFIGMTHKDRHTKPFRYLLSLVFLANTHIIMWGVVFVLALEFFVEFLAKAIKAHALDTDSKRDLYATLTAMALIVVTVLVPLWNSWKSNSDINDKFGSFDRTILTSLNGMLSYQTEGFTAIPFLVILFKILTVVLIVVAFYINARYASMGVFSLLIPAAINTYMRGIDFQKVSCCYFMFALFCWLIKENLDKKQKEESPKKKIYSTVVSVETVLLILLLFASIYTSVTSFNQELRMPFSYASKCADFIEDNLPEDAVILNGSVPGYASSVKAYMEDSPIGFYDIYNDTYITYVNYDSSFLNVANEEYITSAAERFPADAKLYYITPQIEFCESKLEPLVESGFLVEIYRSDISDMQEDYVLYLINR